MRRIGFAALVVLIAAVPAWARIDIIAAQVLDTDKVLINLYSSLEPNPVGMQAPDVSMDNDADIVEVADNNSECMKDTAPEYVDWAAWDKPDCWCYRKQCRGDLNGKSFFGKPVTLSDLNMFKIPFNITDAELELIPNGICADLDHAPFFGKRITISDVNIFKTYFNQPDANVPDCDSTHYNYWIEP